MSSNLLHPSPLYRIIYSFRGECANAWILIPASFFSDLSKILLELALMEIGLYRVASAGSPREVKGPRAKENIQGL